MIEALKNLHQYLQYYKDYPVFSLFVEHAWRYMDIRIFVDQEENPETIVLEAKPAFLLLGKPTSEIESIFNEGAWIISPNKEWDDCLKQTYGNRLDSYQRVLCDESKLDSNAVLQFVKDLPEELRIEPINESHIQSGMIKEDVINRFFPNVNFLEHGYGFALLNKENVVHGFALTNYPIQTNEVEVYYRVGYDSFTKYRNQGIGTTIVSLFIIESLKRGYLPIWDAATPLSKHIALKLGYQEKYHWEMHHLNKK